MRSVLHATFFADCAAKFKLRTMSKTHIRRRKSPEAVESRDRQVREGSPGCRSYWADTDPRSEVRRSYAASARVGKIRARWSKIYGLLRFGKLSASTSKLTHICCAYHRSKKLRSTATVTTTLTHSRLVKLDDNTPIDYVQHQLERDMYVRSDLPRGPSEGC